MMPQRSLAVCSKYVSIPGKVTTKWPIFPAVWSKRGYRYQKFSNGNRQKILAQSKNTSQTKTQKYTTGQKVGIGGKNVDYNKIWIPYGAWSTQPGVE